MKVILFFFFFLIVIGKHHFKFLYVVGKGGFGRVWRVEMKKYRKHYAIKEMAKSKYTV